MDNKYTGIGKILKKLLYDRDIRAADLSREVNIPRPTLHRLITGKSTRPYKSSLKPIAEYFAITVDQLLGKEPLDEAAPPTSTVIAQQSISGYVVRTVPLIPWERLKENCVQGEFQQVPCIGSVSDQGFATLMQDASMEPIFSAGCMLILDRAKTPKDRSYVLACISTEQIPVLRQLIVDADHRYLKALNSDLHDIQMRVLHGEDRILGTLVETRTIFDQNILG